MAHQAHPSKIYILCGNAAFNRGDRANLYSQIKLLQSTFPNAQIVCDSIRPDIDRHWYPAKVIRRRLFLGPEQLREIARSDIVIWGGGALVADNACRLLIPFWFLQIFIVATILRKPVMAWAHGIVIHTRLGGLFARWALNLTRVITVRDENSFQSLEKLGGIRKPIRLTADPTILAKPEEPNVGKEALLELGMDLSKPIVAISPTYWPFYNSNRQWFPYILSQKQIDSSTQPQLAFYNAALGDIADHIVTHHKAQVLFLPRYPCLPWKDVEFLGSMTAHRKSVFIFNRDDLSPPQYLALYTRFKLLVTTALHDSIFASALNIPCIQLFYEPKGYDFFMSLRAEHRMMSWDVLLKPGGGSAVFDLIDQALDAPSTFLPKQAALQELRRRAQNNAEILKQLLQEA